MSMVRAILVSMGLVIALPAVVAAAGAVSTYGDLVNLLVSLMNSGVAVLVALAIVVYFYGITTNILELGSENNPEKKKALFFWGIIILFVMVSIWGILRIMQATLFPYESGVSQQQRT